MGFLIKDIVVSDIPPTGCIGSLWIKYIQEDNSYQLHFPTGSGWQYANIVLSAKEIEDALGYIPESNANKVITIDAQSTDDQYPSAKAVYKLTERAIANSITIGYKPSNKELVILHLTEE